MIVIMKKIQIGVIGDSSCSNEEINLAYEVGKHLALKNCILICGGRGGVMEGASKGAKENNGLIVGILPQINEKTSEANPYLDVVIPTNMGWTRNSLVAMASDGLLVIGGKSGTLSEIAFGWMYEKPIITLDNLEIPAHTWGRKLSNLALDDRRSDIILGISDPKTAVEELIKLIEEKKNRPHQI